MEKLKCKYCGKEFKRPCGLAIHERTCKENLNRKPLENHKCGYTFYQKSIKYKNEKLYCQFCGKECKNLNSLRNHERLCKSNPNRQESSWVKYNKNHEDHKAWNKGLTKETDERVRKNGESISKSYKNGNFRIWSEGLTKETDERIAKLAKKTSESIKEKVKENKWHKSLGKKKRVEYKGIILDSSWEVIVAEYLDKNNIKWEQPKEGFDYVLDGIKHKYYPDFYIPSIDSYIEVKGYERRKDLVKYTVVDNLIIIKYKEIQQILKGEFLLRNNET